MRAGRLGGSSDPLPACMSFVATTSGRPKIPLPSNKNLPTGKWGSSHHLCGRPILRPARGPRRLPDTRPMASLPAVERQRRTSFFPGDRSVGAGDHALPPGTTHTAQ